MLEAWLIGIMIAFVAVEIGMFCEIEDLRDRLQEHMRDHERSHDDGR